MTAEELLKGLTTLHGSELTLASKLEAEYGIDIEYLKDCGDIAASDKGGVIRFDYTAYGKKFQRNFGFDNVREIIYVNGDFINMDDKCKAAILRTLIVTAVRASNNKTVIAQQLAFKHKSATMIKDHTHAGKFVGVDV